MTAPITSSTHYADRTFQDLQLAGLQLEASEFFDCTFHSCVMAEARLQGCRFVRCTFEGCDLSLIQVPESGFVGVRFQGCKLVGVDWTRAAWPANRLGDPLEFTDCLLNLSVFIGLTLQEVAFRECDAGGTDFREADLTRSHFQGTDLEEALFLNTNLEEADFIRARNYQIDPAANQVKGARFALPEALSLLYCLEIELSEDWGE